MRITVAPSGRAKRTIFAADEADEALAPKFDIIRVNSCTSAAQSHHAFPQRRDASGKL